MTRTKIICTIGPSSSSETVLRKLIRAGMNAARVNFSHGAHKDNLALIRAIRYAALQEKAYIPIIQDLQGPRIRVGELPKDGVAVEKGECVVLAVIGSYKLVQGTKHIPVDCSNFHELVRRESVILIEDGTIEFEVIKVVGKRIYAFAKRDALLRSHKGINVPGTIYTKSVITKKDIEDLRFGLHHHVEFIALSFVRNHKDILKLKKLIKKYLPRGSVLPRVIAKIERGEAVKNLDKIISATDAVMVARGDLGLETPAYGVPILEKRIIEGAMKAGKPVIVATQMLDSMIREPRPTRAEVSDVASAVIDHADALMLSGETADGKYPVEACAMMHNIISETEKSPYDDFADHGLSPSHSVEEAFGHGATVLAREAGARMILSVDLPCEAIAMISRFRPSTDIFAAVRGEKEKRGIALSWGIMFFEIPHAKAKDLVSCALSRIAQYKLAKKGEKIIIVSESSPSRLRRKSFLIRVQEI